MLPQSCGAIINPPLAANMGRALEELRTRNDVKWTYVSPAGDFQADGVKTGKIIWAAKNLRIKPKGKE